MEQKYSKLIRLMHWLSVILVLGVIISGFLMVNASPGDFKWQLYSNHKSLGLLIFVIFFIRVIIRLISASSPLPRELSNFWQNSAKVVQFLLYSLMLIVPFCGIAMTLLAGYNLNFFTIPLDFINIVTDMSLANLFKTWHVKLAWGFMFLISMHVIGALKHLIIDKINLFKRII